MNSEMAFQSLLVSKDPEVLRTVNRALTTLSICTRICFHISQAQIAMAEGGIDLIVIDLADERSVDLLRELWRSEAIRKPTIVGITNSPYGIPGIHDRLPRPVTPESTLKCLNAAYSRMLIDYRNHARCALMVSVAALDDMNRLLQITVTDIGYGGVGLRTVSTLDVGRVLAFRLLLPGESRMIHIDARVVWNRDFGRSGCEFVRLSPGDLELLHSWLKKKTPVKEPRASAFVESFTQ